MTFFKTTQELRERWYHILIAATFILLIYVNWLSINVYSVILVMISLLSLFLRFRYSCWLLIPLGVLASIGVVETMDSAGCIGCIVLWPVEVILILLIHYLTSSSANKPKWIFSGLFALIIVFQITPFIDVVQDEMDARGHAELNEFFMELENRSPYADASEVMADYQRCSEFSKFAQLSGKCEDRVRRAINTEEVYTEVCDQSPQILRHCCDFSDELRGKSFEEAAAVCETRGNADSCLSCVNSYFR